MLSLKGAKLVITMLLVLVAGVVLGFLARDRVAPQAAPSLALPRDSIPPAAGGPAGATAATTPAPALPRPRDSEPGARGPVAVDLSDLEVPAERWAAVLAMRAELALGTPADATRLAHLLHACVSVEQQLRSTRQECAARPAGHCPAQLGDLARRQEACRGVPQEDLDRRFELVDRAAAAGDLRAQLMFGQLVPDELRGEENLWRNPERLIEWKARNIAYLEAAAARGAPEAFLRLAAHNREQAAMGEQGRIAALGYYLAWAQTDPRGSGSERGRDVYGAGLTPQQVRRAEAMRDQLLARCCR